MYFSVIIPVYNRPDELKELLNSLVSQSFQSFEVIVMDDGSSIKSEETIKEFQGQIHINYQDQVNQGQGFARNDGMKLAQGEFFVILDSDVILPKNYLEALKITIEERGLDAFGGPDAAKEDFSPLQKAMDFAMTSFWTTGGIRGKLKNPAKYQARGFNMGVSRKVFETIGGFIDPNQGEDIEYSIRIRKAGFRLELVEEAYVYHKRKNTLISFVKQGFSFGRNRINVSRFHPEAIKTVHLLPSLFLVFCISIIISGLFSFQIFLLQISILAIWFLAIFIQSSYRYKSILVGFYSLITSFAQLCAYGLGLIFEMIRKIFKG
ncbi:glycosyltransferase [Algoriphagus sp.]|uniref:glycosyltransferase n=1 Tax=Algoriphagus sp. TaxID=1872435 RepID=UPI0025DA86A7|nr:glycosyltransferase [Algoriphagus sp.]